MPESRDILASAPLPAGLTGDDIRALRKARGMTLANAAAAVGRSIGWLSQVERGRTDPSIADLRRIANLFDVPVSFFFRNLDAPAEERGIIVRAANHVALGTRESGLVEELLSPDISGEFEMIRSVFAAGAQSDDIAARPSEEGGYVVSGELELWIDGRRFHLRAGDSFQFQNAGYRWRNPGTVAAVLVWIVSPPVY